MGSLLSELPADSAKYSALEIFQKINSGELTSESVVRDCLDRIKAHDQFLHAWAFIDAELALEQARACDMATEPKGPLHGIPIGVKDVLDTADMPTEYGSEIYAGYCPKEDSACVAALRKAGAVILGKTTTTEFASPIPVGVRNPIDTTRTPGVSSSGSAAAVADFMVPIANGTQTGGSVILPAAFCGVVGYKASLNGLDRSGIAGLKETLDTLGYFSRSVHDIAIVYEALTANKVPKDNSPITVGLCLTPMWSMADKCAQQVLLEAASKLSNAGYNVEDVKLPSEFDSIEESFRIISNFEGKQALAAEFEHHMEKMNSWMQMTGKSDWDSDDYNGALASANSARRALNRLYEEYPIFLTLSTSGEAPSDLVNASVSSFNRMWTLMHGPSISLPVGEGPNGMPLGIQLVAREGADGELIGHARNIHEILG